MPEESKSEPEAVPSTSQVPDVENKPLIHLVSLPKIVLTRLDINNLPVPVHTSPTKKAVKRLKEKTKPKSLKSNLNKTVSNSKHDTRTRGKPKKNYKALAEFGTSIIESNENKPRIKPVSSISKKEPTVQDSSVKNMLKKTMLQNRSKIAIPPAKKIKLIPKKKLPKPKGKLPSIVSPPKKESISKTKNSSFKMDTNESEDDFLFDELIDEIVNSPKNHPKRIAPEKTTNITLKPNAGNKPPTIVKGGIVKKSSLPPDLKSVANPTTLNSSKHTVISLNVKSKTPMIETAMIAPATADTPKASLPMKASPFPISLNSPSKATPKDQGKKVQKINENLAPTMIENPPTNINTPIKSSKLTGNVQSTKSGGNIADRTPKPRGRPRIGPKQVIRPVPSFNSAEDESDEYTEVETLENMDSEIELSSNMETISNGNEEIQVIPHSSKSPIKPEAGPSIEDKSTNDEDPHLDLLRILTDETENDAETEPSGSMDVESEATQQTPNDNPGHKPTTSGISTNPDTSKPPISPGVDVAAVQDNPSGQQTDEALTVENGEETTTPVHESNVVADEPVVEETPPVRTIYDLINEVALQYPSWNLHIIPETNAFCIAQVTKGRLGLPTLKKCIELDPDTYSAKVYIHQYHIKRFDGIYDSEEAILALIEEIHSIKA